MHFYYLFKNNFLLVFHRYENKKIQAPILVPDQAVLLALASNSQFFSVFLSLRYTAKVGESTGAVLQCGLSPQVSIL